MPDMNNNVPNEKFIEELKNKIDLLEKQVQSLEKEKADLIEVIKTYESMNVIQTMNMMIKKYEELEKKFRTTEEKMKKVESFMKNESGINGVVTRRLEEAIKNNQDIEEEVVLRGGSSDAFATVMNLMGRMQTARSQTQESLKND